MIANGKFGTHHSRRGSEKTVGTLLPVNLREDQKYLETIRSENEKQIENVRQENLDSLGRWRKVSDENLALEFPFEKLRQPKAGNLGGILQEYAIHADLGGCSDHYIDVGAFSSEPALMTPTNPKHYQ